MSDKKMSDKKMSVKRLKQELEHLEDSIDSLPVEMRGRAIEARTAMVAEYMSHAEQPDDEVSMLLRAAPSGLPHGTHGSALGDLEMTADMQAEALDGAEDLYGPDARSNLAAAIAEAQAHPEPAEPATVLSTPARPAPFEDYASLSVEQARKRLGIEGPAATDKEKA